MSAKPESELSLAGRIGAHISWANTEDRAARTAPARAGLDRKFLDQADGDPLKAASLRKAHFARLAKKSAETRRKNAAARAAGKPRPPKAAKPSSHTEAVEMARRDLSAVRGERFESKPLPRADDGLACMTCGATTSASLWDLHVDWHIRTGA